MAKQRKYEFIPGDEIAIAPGRTVKRIRALDAIAALGVVAGEAGGYVEHEKNLAQVSGNAWVFGNARVSGDAEVSGNAWVFGNARVSGNAEVFGNAWVSGNARVAGNAWVSGDARVFGNAQVFGNARVSGDAEVFGNAWVSGNARVAGNARVFGDARVAGLGLIFWASIVGTENGTLTVYNAKDNTLEVTRGCFSGSADEFLAASAAKHDEATRHEYKLLIEVATSRINRAMAAPPAFLILEDA